MRDIAGYEYAGEHDDDDTIDDLTPVSGYIQPMAGVSPCIGTVVLLYVFLRPPKANTRYAIFQCELDLAGVTLTQS